MQPRLATVHFHCKECKDVLDVVSLGEVVSGPICPRCHKPMKRVEIVQSELPLFDEPKQKGRQGRRRKGT